MTNDPSRQLYSARQLGLGGLAIGFADDANGVFSNPSGLTDLKFPQLTATSRKILLDETQYLLAGWAFPSPYGTFGVGYTGMGTGGSLPTMLDPATGRIIQNPSLEAGSNSASTLALSYSQNIRNISVGGNLKFFSQALSGGGYPDSGSGLGLDLSASFRPLRWLTLGASLQNIMGGSIKWSASEDKMGGFYKIGGAFNLLGVSEESLVNHPQKLRAGVDVDLPGGVLSSNNSLLYHLGLEYFPLKNVALRAGLNQEAAGTGLGFGVGLINGGFRFDYAFAQRAGVPGDNPHYFTLSYIGERVLTVDRKLKRKLAQLKISHPRDRLITDMAMIDVSAEARAVRIIDQKRTWTVPSIAATSDAFDVSEPEDLYQAFLNGKKLERGGTIESAEPLASGRNVIQLIGFTSPEVNISSTVSTAEVRVLRISPFSDTPLNYWAIEPISLNVVLGLVTGYPDNSFKPDKGISRAELVSLLVRSLALPTETLDSFGNEEVFTDVKINHWAAKFIGYGSAVKFVTGYPNGSFKPNKVLNRAEGVTILARYAGLSEAAATTTAPYPDLKPDFWANKFIAPARATGLLKYLEGKDFEPAKEFTRAEACEVLYRVPGVQKKVNEFWETGTVLSATPTPTPTPSPTPAPAAPSTFEAR